MSVAQNSGIRKTARQFSVALVACLAVAGGAALVAAPEHAPAGQRQQAGADDDWPFPAPTTAAPIN